MADWIGSLPPAVYETGAPWLLVFLCIMALLSGRLVTRRVLRDYQNSADARVSAADVARAEWRDQAFQTAKLLADLTEQNRQLLRQQDQLLVGQQAFRQALSVVPASPAIHSEGGSA